MWRIVSNERLVKQEGMPSFVPDNLRRQVRSVVHRVCMQRHRGEVDAPDLEAELSDLFAHEGLERPADDELSRWLDEDHADFDRAVLVSELISESERRPASEVISVPVPVPVTQRTPEPARPAVEQPTRPARLNGAPSVADLLDGMFAQQGRR